MIFRNRRLFVSSMVAAPLLTTAAIGSAQERGIVGRQAPELDAEFWLAD